MEAKMETRIITIANGFKVEQVRFLPVAEWEPNDGWRTTRYVPVTQKKEGIKHDAIARK